MRNLKLKSFIATILILASGISYAALRESDRQVLEKSRNMLLNPGAENGLAKFALTGGGSFTKETGSPLDGPTSFSWDASATGEFLSSASQAIPQGLKGRRCSVEIKYSWNAGVQDDLELQAFDGTNVLVALKINPTTTLSPTKDDFALFTCPASGNLVWRLESTADAAVIVFDKLHLGEPTRQVSVAGAEQIAHAAYPATTSCIWTVTSTSLVTFPVDTDCPAIVVDQSVFPVNTADDDLPNIVFDNLPPGNYLVSAAVTLGGGAAAASISVAISDGTDTRGVSTQITTSTADLAPMKSLAVFTYTATAARTFTLFGQSSSGTAELNLNDSFRTLVWTVTRYPLASEKSISFDQADWHIDANIGGANISLGVGSQSVYVAITNATLDLVTNPGSHPVQIACASGTASTGATCSVDEAVGIAFVIPYAGKYKACVTTNLKMSQAGDNTFQLVETTNTSDATLQEGNIRVPIGNDGASDLNSSTRICSYFEFASAGQKTIRMKFEKSASTGNPAIIMDRSASFGQRDMHWDVRPVSQFKGGIRFDNMVESGNASGMHMETVFIDETTGTPAIGYQSGGATSVTDLGVGHYRINWTAGTFNDADSPVCTCSLVNANSASCSIDAANNSNSVTAVLVEGATEESDVNLVCIGRK